MSVHPHAVRRFLWRALWKMVFCLALAAGTLLLYANIVGIPAWVADPILERLNRGGFAIDIGRASLVGVRCVRVSDAALYRKRVLGPPMFEAALVNVELSPLAWLQGKLPVVSVSAEHASWRLKKGRSNMAQPPRLLGMPFQFRVEVRDCRVGDVMLDHISFILSGAGKRVDVDTLAVTLSRDGRAGDMTGQLSYDMSARVLSGRVVTSLDPRIVKPLVDASGLSACTKLISRFTFDGEAPRGEWTFDRRLSEKQDIHLTGDFRMRDCSYRGVDLLRADGSITVDRRELVFNVEMNNLFMVRREGMANVAFSVDPRDKRLEFSVESSIQPLAMARMVGVLTNLFTQHVVFNGGCSIEGRGVVDYGDLYAATDLTGVVQADHVNLHQLQFEKGYSEIRMLGRTLTLTNLQAQVHSGSATGVVDVIIPPRTEQPRVVCYRMDVQYQDVDFEAFMNDVARPVAKLDYEGLLFGSLKVEGELGKRFQRSLNGEGFIEIRDGRVFMLPLFGGLSRFMTRIIPGLDFVLRQSDARSTFRIVDGRVEAHKLFIEGGVLSLSGDGTFVLGGNFDFDIQLRLMKEHSLVSKLVRVLTYPISKLFEFRLRGTLADPHWYPVHFSRDILERIGLRKREPNVYVEGRPESEEDFTLEDSNEDGEE